MTDRQHSHTEIPQKSEEYHYRHNRRLFHRILATFLLIGFSVGVFWTGYSLGTQEKARSLFERPALLPTAKILNTTDSDSAVDFSLFWDAWSILKEKYVDRKEIDAQNLLYGAIGGMLQATGDPYTVFLTPKQNQLLTEDLNGSFEGIGAEIGIRDSILTVIAPLDDSPAEKAGLRPGDHLLEINGESTVDLSIEQAIDKIRGPKNSDVVFTILRSGEQDTRTITVTRDVIVVTSVRIDFLDGNIAHLRVTQFSEDTITEFNAAIRNMNKHETKNIILDLRNNPGGFLNSAVDLASRMLPRDTIVVIEEDGDGKQTQLRAKGGDVLSDIPTIILINQGSASASEILAGALRDNRTNVTIIGEKSFGKGSVQELIGLKQNAAVKITVAKWLTPSGKQINNVGISPDIEVKRTNDDIDAGRDPQRDKAMELIRTGKSL